MQYLMRLITLKRNKLILIFYDEKVSCDALQKMANGDVRLQDPSNQSQKTSPNNTTPPAQGFDQDNHEENDDPNNRGQEESND
jgi:hypothetical protein